MAKLKAMVPEVAGADLTKYAGNKGHNLVIGLPPLPRGSDKVNMWLDNLSKDSMLLIQLTPMVPSIKVKPPQLFRLEADPIHYKKEVMAAIEGAGLPPVNFKVPLTIAAMAETSPSESFSSSYEQSFLGETLNSASSTLTQLLQMTGATNPQELAQKLQMITNETKGALKNVHGMGGTVLRKIVGAIGGISVGTLHTLNKIAAKHGAIGNLIANMLMGYKINFPKIWSSASYSPSYTFTIRLYNPDVSGENKEAITKYYIQPLAMLLAFVVPRAGQLQHTKIPHGAAYTWPFFCRARAPGLFYIKTGAITDISITKGSDNISLGYTQIAGIIDVRLTITDLYDVIVANGARDCTSSLYDYLQILSEPKPVLFWGDGDEAEFKFAEANVPTSKNAAFALDRSPSQRASSTQLLANDVLNNERVNSLFAEYWPPELTDPDDETKQLFLNQANDPEIADVIRDYKRSLTINKDKVIDHINALAQNTNQPVTDNVRSIPVSSQVFGIGQLADFTGQTSSLPVDKIIPSKMPVTDQVYAKIQHGQVIMNDSIKMNSCISGYMTSNPTNSEIFNTALAQKASTIKNVQDPKVAKSIAVASVRSIDQPMLKSIAKKSIAAKVQPKITPTLKEKMPNLSDSQVHALSNTCAEIVLDIS